MIVGMRHVGLVVADLDKSIKFWCGTMGFSVLRQMEESGPHIDAIMGLNNVRVTTSKLSAPDGSVLELLYFNSHPEKNQWEGTPFSTGFTHIAMTVQNLAETISRLSIDGVQFQNEPQYSPDGKVLVTYAIGPENVIIELVEELQ